MKQSKVQLKKITDLHANEIVWIPSHLLQWDGNDFYFPTDIETCSPIQGGTCTTKVICTAIWHYSVIGDTITWKDVSIQEGFDFSNAMFKIMTGYKEYLETHKYVRLDHVSSE